MNLKNESLSKTKGNSGITRSVNRIVTSVPAKLRIPVFGGSLLLVAALLFMLNKTPGDWWKGDWPIRKKIVLDAKAAEIAEPVGSFPLLVRLHEGDFQFSAAKEDGSDLRFIAEDNKTVLAHQIEKYDSMLCEGFVWVNVPASKEGKPVKLALYYGNTRAAEEKPAERKGVYDVDTVLVYHFSDGVQPCIDASGKGNTSQNAAATTDGSYIGSGMKLEGSSVVNVPATPSLEWNPQSGVTITAWVKPAVLQPNGIIFSRREAGGTFLIGVDNGIPFVDINGQRSGAGAALAANAWRQISIVAEATKTTVYLDGETYSALPAGVPALKGPIQIGGDFKGELDELMISKTARPVSYVKALALSQGGEVAAKFVALSPDQNLGGGGEQSHFGVILKSVTLDGWIVIGLCILMAVGSWYVMIQKATYLKAAAKGSEEFLKEWREVASDLSVLDHGDPEKVKTMGGRVDSDREEEIRSAPVYRIYHIGAQEIKHRKDKGSLQEKGLSAQSIESIRASLDAGVVRETQKLNSLMVLLTISIAGGPFLGLLGTVVGVMITFAAIAAAGEVNVNSIAPGIAAALVATVAGLGVAIPALFGYNYLVSKIKDATSDMQVFVDEFVTRMAEYYCSQGE